MALKVFYVDDEIELCELFSEHISSSDVVVSTFSDPNDLIKACAESAPDIVFIDYRMPHTNGDQMAQSLDAKIPKYLITGEISAKTGYKFEKTFLKPCDYTDIVKTISLYL